MQSDPSTAVLVIFLVGLLLGCACTRHTYRGKMQKLQADLSNTIAMHQVEMQYLSMRSQQSNRQSVVNNVQFDLAEAVEAVHRITNQQRVGDSPRPQEMTAAQFLNALSPAAVEYLRNDFNQQRQLANGGRR